MSKLNSRRGFVLIEAVVAITVASVIILGLLGVSALTLSASLSNAYRLQAIFLTEEGLEAVRIMRDSSWEDNIAQYSSGNPFYISFDGSSWQATSSLEYVDGIFYREVAIEDVYRDANQEITTSGGTLDLNTKKVSVSVSWQAGSATSTKSLSTYITNIFLNNE